MYNALDQDLLRQQMRDRGARRHSLPVKDDAAQHRRWWRRASRRTR